MSDRSTAFNSIYERSIAEVFHKCSWKKMTEIFPELMAQERHKHDLKEVHTKVNDWFQSHAKRDCQVIIDEKQVYENLDRLQECVENARGRQSRCEQDQSMGPADAPLDIKDVSPRDLTACMLRKDRLESIHKLERETAEIDSSVLEVDRKIAEKQAEVDDLWRQITDVCDRFNSQ